MERIALTAHPRPHDYRQQYLKPIHPPRHTGMVARLCVSTAPNVSAMASSSPVILVCEICNNRQRYSIAEAHPLAHSNAYAHISFASLFLLAPPLPPARHILLQWSPISTAISLPNLQNITAVLSLRVYTPIAPSVPPFDSASTRNRPPITSRSRTSDCPLKPFAWNDCEIPSLYHLLTALSAGVVGSGAVSSMPTF
ncbi:hypothetical protein B0H14DRAFT_2705208 [Mycena olivaceomarginata]|nr:hypothetical protein B0H14DRAFT_2705208 [Mycena olivaceomarginata]